MKTYFLLAVYCFLLYQVRICACYVHHLRSRLQSQSFKQSKSQVSASPVPEEEEKPDAGGLLGKATNFFNENKGTLLSAVIPDDSNPTEILEGWLKKMDINSTTITDLTSSFTGKEAITDLINAFSNPEKLQKMLEEKTGMDPETIKSFTETVKSFK